MPERLRTAELLADAEAAERAAVLLRAELGDALGRARAREAELEREHERIQASAERARVEAVAETERELAEARAELSALREDLRLARRRKREPEQDRLLGSATERANRAERSLRDLGGPLPPSGTLAEGDPVEAPDVGVRGTIASIRGADAEVIGAAGQRVRIPLARLRPSRERVPEDRTPAVQVRTSARSDVSDQLDVRGLAGQEAREQVRRLVDEAALAGLHEVRIVHGRGTGALRAAVREELGRHPLVEGHAADADDGATVVTLG
jgi:DNA mismatch repair protein MutS2